MYDSAAGVGARSQLGGSADEDDEDMDDTLKNIYT